jgi:glycine cleavage system protein P-like pyridoxal-binding family
MEDTVRVEVTISLPMVIEETVMEEPTNVENCPALIFNDDIAALETYSLPILLDVTLKRYPLM